MVGVPFIPFPKALAQAQPTPLPEARLRDRHGRMAMR
jgi:hypothetical protein